jgi:UMF1 family MFS transporter
MFDFANSPFPTIMITAFYGAFFQSHVVPHALAQRSHTMWAATVSASMALVAASSPVVGAVADQAGLKRRLLAVYVALCALATTTVALWPIGTTTGMWLSMLSLVIANAAFEGGYVFYNAFLTELAPGSDAGRLSGYGWGLGYVGGLAALAIVRPLVASTGGDSWRVVPLVVACWYATFALPMLLLVRERAPRVPAPAEGWLRAGFRGVRATVRTLREYPDLARFLIAYLIFTDALETVLVFTGSFSQDALHFTPEETVRLFLVLNVMAIPGALVFGRLVDRWGGVKSVAASLVLWLAVVAGCVLVRTKEQFLGVGVLAALGVGGTQSAARAVVSRYAPPREAARVFGFMTMAGKASAVVGPLVYGLVADATGSMRAAVGTISLFFMGGLLLLARVDERRALERAAPQTEPGLAT